MRTDFFRRIYNSGNLSNEELKRITSFHHQITVKKDDFVLQKGQQANEYYLIESGLFRSYVTDYKGREMTTGFFTPNHILIEPLSLFARIPTKENFKSLTNSTVWKIDFQHFQQLYHSIDAFEEWGRKWMSNELFACKQRSIEMLTLNATERYKKLMEQQPDILSSAPLKDIASYLGVTDSSLSRIRKEITKS